MRDRKIWETNPGPTLPVGHGQAPVGNVAVGLPNLPGGITVRRVVLRNLGQPITWRDDGTAPTASTGMAMLTNEILVHDLDDASTFQMIAATGNTGSADVRTAYYA